MDLRGGQRNPNVRWINLGLAEGVKRPAYTGFPNISKVTQLFTTTQESEKKECLQELEKALWLFLNTSFLGQVGSCLGRCV